MQGVSITINDILWAAAAITTIAAAYKIIKNNPISQQGERMDGIEKKLANDFVRLQEAEKADKIMCKCLLALIDHEITGNGIDRMKQIRADLQQYLIDK